MNESVGTRLEDNTQHTERTGNAFEIQARVQLAAETDGADGVGKIGYIQYSLHGSLELAAVQFQAAVGRRRDLALRCL